MISPELQLTAIDPAHYANLTRLLHPPAGGDPEPRPWGPLAQLFPPPEPRPEAAAALSPQMPALILHRDGRALRALQLGGGTLPLDGLSAISEATLHTFRQRHGLPLAAALDLAVLPGLMTRLQRAVNLDDDYVAQLLAMARVLKEALGQGLLVDPRPWGAMPLPPYALLQATFNQLLPDDHSFVFYLADSGTLWTSLIAVKRGGDLVQLTTHAALATLRFSSVQGDAKAVVRAVSQQLAPVHIGLFLPLRVWHELVAGDRSAVARAIANRQAVLDPAPPWLLALVGAGAMAEAATRSLKLAGRLLSASGLGARLPGAATAQRLMQTVSNPFEALGIDPWELLTSARDWARRLELDRDRFAPPPRARR